MIDLLQYDEIGLAKLIVSEITPSAYRAINRVKSWCL